MKIEATSPEEYLGKIPEERQEVFGKLRQIILEHLPNGFEETMSYGMIGYVVPHQIYPEGYHCDPSLPLPFLSIASQKNFIGFYHMGIYAMPKLYQWFVQEYPKHARRKLDMGKSCVRFKKMDDIPFKLIADLVSKVTPQDWIEVYEKTIKR